MKVVCVIPAYNEEHNILQVIRDVKPLVNEIVVVDDNSTDNTKNILRGEGVILLHHIINRGQGAALETGDKYAIDNGADIVIHFDADGQFNANDIKKLVEPIINDDYEIVLGSRMLGDRKAIPPIKRFFIFPLAHLANYVFWKARLTDPQCGLRAIKKDALTKIIIEQDKMAHTSEIIGKIFSNNLKYKEVPVNVIYKEFGQSFSGGFKILKDLVLAKFIN